MTSPVKGHLSVSLGSIEQITLAVSFVGDCRTRKKMFGGQNKRWKSIMQETTYREVLIPSLSLGYHRHYARQSNTDQLARMLHHQQKLDDDKLREEIGKKQTLRDAIETHFEKHTVKKRYQKYLANKIQQKWQNYEATIEARRHRLRKILEKEEREFYYEVACASQENVGQKIEEIKKKTEMLKAKREAERLQTVHQKKIEKYRDRCQELRSALSKQHLMESKYAQLQQIMDKKAEKEADRELDKMWHELTLKDIQVKKDREMQEVLERENKKKETLQIWDMQVKRKELLKQEMDREAQDDKLKMEKLSEELRKEETKALNEKKKRRDKEAKQVLEQIEIQRQLQAQKTREENTFEQAFATLTQAESEKEQASLQDAIEKAKNETALYHKYLKELEEERKLEEKQLIDLLEIQSKIIEAKENKARRQIKVAKQQLQQNVMVERAEQIYQKKLKAEQQLKLKEVENEILKMALETNESLQIENDRLEKQAVLQYRDDLQKQIRYNNVLRQKEREELENEVKKGLKDEEKYKQIVEQILIGEAQGRAQHPFRRALEQHF